MVVSIIREKEKEREKEYVIVSVYNEENNWRIIEEVIKRMVQEYKEDHVIIGGDLNANRGRVRK